MEDNNTQTNSNEFTYLSWKKNQRRGKIVAGILVVLFGSLFLINEMGFHLPRWIFGWEMILIGIGVVMVVKHKFKKMSAYLLILIGFTFLMKDFYPTLVNVRILWPIVIIVFGLSLIFKSRNSEKEIRKYKKKFGHFPKAGLEGISSDDFIDSVSFFSGVQKNVLSKNFKGADIVTVFGGSEISLAHADFEGEATMDITTVFGGMTLVIPPNWQVRSEVVSVFGGVEDKRPTWTGMDLSTKVLVLRGSCVFGGVEINSLNI